MGLNASSTKSLLKSIYSTTAVQYLLLTRIERMALRTYFNKNVLAQSGLGLDYIATATSSFHGFVFWMNSGFHDISS